MRRRVQVDPGDQPVPRFGVEFDVVMALFEQLDQLGGIGVVFPRRKHVGVAFDGRRADELAKLEIGRREMGPAVVASVFGLHVDVGPMRQIGNGLAVRVWSCRRGNRRRICPTPAGPRARN